METEYTVAEREGAFIDVVVQTNDVVDVGTNCRLTTVDGSAIAGKDHNITLSRNDHEHLISSGSDYITLHDSFIMFSSHRESVRINITNDDVVEDSEMFTVRLSSASNDVRIVGDNSATVTIIDSDSM